MGFFPSLPEETNLSDVYKAYPGGIEALFRYHDHVLRGPSPLSIGERELIAAYVSGLNGCEFCFNAHRVYAETYGFEPDTFEGLFDNLESSNLPDNLKPLLAYAGKLTKDLSGMMQSDVTAILEAGWSEQAVHDAMTVTALFNFMNRIIHGSGVAPFDGDYETRLERLRKIPIEKRKAFNQDHLGNDHYVQYGRSIGVIKD